MNRAVFDTRFFMAGYYSTNEVQTKKLGEKVRSTKERFVSAVVLHEVYQISLRKNGSDTAKLRTALVEKDFEVIAVTADIAKSSAELRSKYDLSMADSIIAATALSLKATCLSDDPHFKAVKEIKTDWI
ncbi:MAG: PIN domain-containing protein [Candidatus Bathyarchaeota archaeon]|nr:PIN domain-containing protein [Candidatus Bathyarchaeota archaeon]